MVWFLCREACGISAPQPGMEPVTPASEAEVLTTVSPRKPPEFSFSKMKGVLEKDGGDGCTEMGMSVTWLNSTPQNSQDGKFYVRCCCCCEVAPVIQSCSARLCATPWTAAHQAPPSLGFSRQEHWSGLPLPSPGQESEKRKWSRSVVSGSVWSHRQQPTRLLRPWDFSRQEYWSGVP